MDRKAYDGLTKVYTNAMSKVYEREIRHFFEQAKSLISNQLTHESEMNTSMSSKFKSPQAIKQVSQPWGILGVNKEQWSNGLDTSERQRFDSILEKVLAELEPVALSEQHFCIRFFQLDVLSPTTKNTQTTLDGMAATVSAGAAGDGNFGDISGKDEKEGAQVETFKYNMNLKLIIFSLPFCRCRWPSHTKTSRSSN